MRNRPTRAPILAIALAIVGRSAGAGDLPEPPPKKVLVEVFRPRGPAAPDLLGALPGRVVAIQFLDDSGPARRRREEDPALLRKPDASKPLLFVDGRPTIAGAGLESAWKAALREAPGVDLDLDLDGPALRKTLSLKIAGLSPDLAGRVLRVGVALTEGPASTRASEGEAPGKAAIGRQVVRWFDARPIRLDRSGARALAVPIDLPEGGVASRFRVVAFVRDPETGAILQADSIAWTHSHAPAAEPGPLASRRKARRPASAWPSGLDPFLWNPPNADGSMTCPACGNTFMPPLAPIHVKPGQMILVPQMTTC